MKQGAARVGDAMESLDRVHMMKSAQDIYFQLKSPGNMWPSHCVSHVGRRQQTLDMNWSFWSGRDVGQNEGPPGQGQDHLGAVYK